jgi:hypothetical protein
MESRELEGVDTDDGLVLPWAELVSFGMDLWSQEVVEEALGPEMVQEHLGPVCASTMIYCSRSTRHAERLSLTHRSLSASSKAVPAAAGRVQMVRDRYLEVFTSSFTISSSLARSSGTAPFLDTGAASFRSVCEYD